MLNDFFLFYFLRCASEIIAGLIRGTKHWSWDMTVNLWSWMQPLLRKVVSKITVESFGNWGTCFATASESRDPQRIHWMLEALMEEPIQSKGKQIQGDPNQNFRCEIAVPLKVCISDSLLVKPKCV